MENNHKLLEGIQALLRAEGFENVTTLNAVGDVTVSGDKGRGGAFFYCTTHRREADTTPTVEGGRLADASTEEARVVPSIPGLHEQLASVMSCMAPVCLPPEVLQALLLSMGSKTAR